MATGCNSEDNTRARGVRIRCSPFKNNSTHWRFHSAETPQHLTKKILETRYQNDKFAETELSTYQVLLTHELVYWLHIFRSNNEASIMGGLGMGSGGASRKPSAIFERFYARHRSGQTV